VCVVCVDGWWLIVDPLVVRKQNLVALESRYDNDPAELQGKEKRE
jgi:hypothetical protein